MHPATVYRFCIWLPIVVPAIAIALARAFEYPLARGIVLEMLVYSLVYGGLPYTVLAIWATWWVGGRSEPAIRRLMLLAPLVMAGIFVPLALIVGVAVGSRGPFAGVAALGAVVILLLGYSYVALALLLRRVLGPRDTTVP